MKKIIVLEDNKEINKILTDILLKEGYQVFPSFNAIKALEDFKEHHIDAILTDLMLPIMSGEEFIQEIRKISNVHIIVISAKTAIHEKLEGLKKGADDYLYKPFIEEEVIIKLENLFIKKDYHESIITLNNKTIKFQEGKNQLIINNEIIPLTSVEYLMLKLLFQEVNKVISREQFLDVLYLGEADVFDRVIDVHIRNIRAKIKKVHHQPLVKTVYGLGYTLVGEVDD